jgi:hypothetical protein
MSFAKIVVLFSLLSFSSITWGEDITYLCIATKSTGFYYDKSSKEWTNTTFKISDSKKLIKKKGSSWEWSEFGDKHSRPYCKERGKDYVDCNTFGGELSLNTKNMRYMETYIFGYIDGQDNNDNTPAITIGKCSPL